MHDQLQFISDVQHINWIQRQPDGLGRIRDVVLSKLRGAARSGTANYRYNSCEDVHCSISFCLPEPAIAEDCRARVLHVPRFVDHKNQQFIPPLVICYTVRSISTVASPV